MASPVIKQTTSREIEFQGRLVAAQLKAWLADIPDNADINITEHRGDQRDPDYTTIEASWSSNG